jgi:hypothetical protein
MRHRIAAGVFALGIIAGLTACAQSAPGPSPTSTPSATSSAATATCDDGVAVLRADGQKGHREGCALFNVLGHRNHLDIGAVEQLTIEGDHNTVTVEDVDVITSSGDDNTVYYEGDEPDFNELGSGTEVLPAAAR